MATAKKATTYIATNLSSYEQECFEGTLESILEEMEDSERRPDDFLFYRAERINVRFEKKLVLVEDKSNGNS